MNIIIHDFAGHQFQVSLSRELARRGHRVYHLYFAEDPGPKGVMKSEEFGDGSVKMLPVSVGAKYSKTSLFGRFLLDLKYRKQLELALKGLTFDVLISSNTPTWVQGAALRVARQKRAVFVFWCQDVYGYAVSEFLRRRLGLIGRAIGRALIRMDVNQMNRSDRILKITSSFDDLFDEWGVSREKSSTLENWGALNEFELHDRDNHWYTAHKFSMNRLRVVYSGTLGYKHNPDILSAAASRFPNVDFIVTAAGAGADELMKREMPSNLYVLPLQEFHDLPYVLRGGDVLVAIIEADAALFSVPSKVLSYLCAGRAIILSAPSTNLAAETISFAQAGEVVSPHCAEDFMIALGKLLSQRRLRELLGLNGRRYAETYFPIEVVADRFLSEIAAATAAADSGRQWDQTAK